MFQVLVTMSHAQRTFTFNVFGRITDSGNRPLCNVSVDLWIYISDRSAPIQFSAISDSNGAFMQTVSHTLSSGERLSYGFPITQFSFHGLWVLQSVAGERIYRASDGLWFGADEKIFRQNQSRYIVRDVSAETRWGGQNSVNLMVNLQLSPGILKNVTHLSSPETPIEILPVNFVQVGGLSSTIYVVPLDHLFRANVTVHIPFPPSWELRSYEFEIAETLPQKETVDITHSIVEGLTNTQLSEIRQGIDGLKKYGFPMANEENQHRTIQRLFTRGLESFAQGDIDESVRLLMNGELTFFSLKDRISSVNSEAPIFFIFFSFFVACLSFILTRLLLPYKERTSASRLRFRSSYLFLLLFIGVFFFFARTQPYLRFFLDRIIHPSPYWLFLGFSTFTLLFVLAIATVSIFTMFRDRLGKLGISLSYCMDGFKRRRDRSLLTILTVAIMSMGIASFITITSTSIPVKRLLSYSNIDYGLVVYPPELKNTFKDYEFRVVLSLNESEEISTYSVKRLGAAVKNPITNSEEFFTVVAANPDFINKYSNFNTSMMKGKTLTSDDDDYVLIGQLVAAWLQVGVDDELVINGYIFKVKGIFDYIKAMESSDLDGTLLFSGVDPNPEMPQTQTFIVGLPKTLGQAAQMEVSKISVTVKEQYRDEIGSIANRIFEDYGYICNAIDNGQVIGYGQKTLSILGWQYQIIPILLVFGQVSATLLASVTEKKREITTMAVIGLDPTSVLYLFLVEAFSIGLIGGFVGYVFAYGFMHAAMNLAMMQMPSEILSNFFGVQPFFLSVFLPILSSVVASVLPAKRAVLSIIPSGEERIRAMKEVKFREGKATLEIPLVVSILEKDFFDKYVEYVFQKYQGRNLGLITRDFTRKESSDGLHYQVGFTYCHEKSLVRSDYVIDIVLPESKIAKPTIVISSSQLKSDQSLLSMERERNALKIVIPALRKDFLLFSEWKKRATPITKLVFESKFQRKAVLEILKRSLNTELQKIEEEAKTYELRLRDYESRFGMSSISAFEEFYGKELEHPEIGEWIQHLENYNRLTNQARVLRELINQCHKMGELDT